MPSHTPNYVGDSICVFDKSTGLSEANLWTTPMLAASSQLAKSQTIIHLSYAVEPSSRLETC